MGENRLNAWKLGATTHSLSTFAVSTTTAELVFSQLAFSAGQSLENAWEINIFAVFPCFLAHRDDHGMINVTRHTSTGSTRHTVTAFTQLLEWFSLEKNFKIIKFIYGAPV